MNTKPRPSNRKKVSDPDNLFFSVSFDYIYLNFDCTAKVKRKLQFECQRKLHVGIEKRFNKWYKRIQMGDIR